MLEALSYSSWGLTSLLLLPALGMAAVLLAREEQAKHIALGVALLTFLASLPLWFGFNPNTAAFQLGRQSPWIPQWGINFQVAVDGISMLLVLLTTLWQRRVAARDYGAGI